MMRCATSGVKPAVTGSKIRSMVGSVVMLIIMPRIQFGVSGETHVISGAIVIRSTAQARNLPLHISPED